MRRSKVSIRDTRRVLAALPPEAQESFQDYVNSSLHRQLARQAEARAKMELGEEREVSK